MTTKQIILDKSLDLFAEKGYYATSVRDIAKAVGIKDSSLYFHFTNKQAILDSITEEFIKQSNEMMKMMSNAVNELQSMSDQMFLSVTEQYISTYFLNDFIRKYIIVMNHEQSNNETIREIYRNWFIDQPLKFQEQLFQKLSDISYLKKGNISQMVIAYYSPIFLFFNKCISYNTSKEDDAEFISNTLQTTKHFLDTYKEKTK